MDNLNCKILDGTNIRNERMVSMRGNPDYIGDHENSNRQVEIAKYWREKMKYWIFIVKMK